VTEPTGILGGLVYQLRVGVDPEVPLMIMLHDKRGDEKMMSISFRDQRCFGRGTILNRLREQEIRHQNYVVSVPIFTIVRRTSVTNLRLNAPVV
jgi:hypothetical protein